MASPRPSTKDRVHAHVKEGILAGIYPGGELISEGQVAQELGCSRTPVREAFLVLEAEGLMRLYPKRGALVVEVSAREIAEVMEVRAVVECHAVATLAAAGSPAAIEATRRLIDAQDGHAARGEGPGFVEADRQFHRALMEALGNRVLLGLYDTLRDRQRRMGAVVVARDPGVMRDYIADHRAIVAAIEAGDGELAGRAMAGHIARARGRLLGVHTL